jgi:hypothetical protein
MPLYQPASIPSRLHLHPLVAGGKRYRRTSISGTKKGPITFLLRHFFPLKVVK